MWLYCKTLKSFCALSTVYDFFFYFHVYVCTWRPSVKPEACRRLVLQTPHPPGLYVDFEVWTAIAHVKYFNCCDMPQSPPLHDFFKVSVLFHQKSFNKEKITSICEYASYAYFLQSLTKPKRNYKIMKTENMPRHILFTLITIVHTYEKLSLAPHFKKPGTMPDQEHWAASTERAAVCCATADTISCPWGRSPGLTQARPVPVTELPPQNQKHFTSKSTRGLGSPTHAACSVYFTAPDAHPHPLGFALTSFSLLCQQQSFLSLAAHWSHVHSIRTHWRLGLSCGERQLIIRVQHN